jgi:hypothetical protein
MHAVVAHFVDGTILKGTTGNFRPNIPEFHLRTDDGSTTSVEVDKLKGLFFVRDLDGDPEHRARGDVDRTGLGRKVEVVFSDGEVLAGYTTGYAPNRPAFWVTPADPDSNNERIYVVAAATASVRFLE